ncbi:uncharacterized protein KY384_004881 [Bacidia gigantensis]|uniref:uncharacterized protein n=1 Tax=Bacidia gigantensis TaxID=2732470 RepID=UPI001D042C7A|nr:uncharacterized protein KY384_004881 [Bacidia gigantensis]KAG8530379.1 hypothetical protein KY384_004881 [Bacidia gigantensis]
MSDQGDLEILQGIHQDLIDLSKAQLRSVERLWAELDARVDEFRKLLDRPRKNEASRKSLLSGTVIIDDVEYAVNKEFQESATQLADTLDLDEIQSTKLLLETQGHIAALDRSVISAAAISFHQHRRYLLECLRWTIYFSLDADVEGDTRSASRDLLSLILETKNGTPQNGASYIQKCLQTIFEMEGWLQELGERTQGTRAMGHTLTQEGDEILKFQQQSLTQQHESLAAIISLLAKASYSTTENFCHLLDHLSKMERWTQLTVHYAPIILAFILQHGSPEGVGSLPEARALHTKLLDTKDSSLWKMRHLQAATQAWWLAEYSGWYQEQSDSSQLQGLDLEAEARGRSESFFRALRDGAFECTLTMCSQSTPEEWYDPARASLVAFLLGDAPSLQPEVTSLSDWFRLLFMEQLESFVDALITNMPDTLRQFKFEEDDQRKRIHSNLQSKSQGGTHEQDLHLERFLVLISFSFDSRVEAAQSFWGEIDSNMYGFLQWASKRQSTPSVGAFCEMLQSISKSDTYATAAHNFLLEDSGVSYSRIRRTGSLSWALILGELSVYASRVREPASSGKGTNFYGGKPTLDDIEEPESVLMLESYLRLMSHLCGESAEARAWLFSRPNPSILDTLFTLCSPTVPNTLQACAFIMVRSLLTSHQADTVMNIWNSLDVWASGGYAPLSSARAAKLANPESWMQEITFGGVVSTFDQANDFTALLHTLMSPSYALDGVNERFSFPENLGSSYRTPGVEPYVDLVLDKVFAGMSTQVEDRLRKQVLTFNVLTFVTTCLSTFNEDLLLLGTRNSSALTELTSTSSLTMYLRLHPFCRTMEWLFNGRVLSALFDAAHENVEELMTELSGSPMVLSLLRTIQTMSLLMDLQSTYLNVARPLVHAQRNSRQPAVFDSSLASFEDSVALHLQLVVDLGLYTGLGNSDLAVASLKLLGKLASSRRLQMHSIQSSSRTGSRSSLINILEREDDVERITQPLILAVEINPRELEHGPNSDDWTMKSVILEFLVKTLSASANQPCLAHTLLGFTSRNMLVEIAPGGNFSKGLSLFHSVVRLVADYPDGEEGTMQMWALSLRQMGMEVLSILWRSSLTSAITLTELREAELVFRLFVRQSIMSLDTLWDGHAIREQDFMVTDAAETLQQFLWQRNSFYEYAVMEIRAAALDDAPSLKTRLLSTLFGSTTSTDGEQYSNPSVLDLFDFMEFEIPSLEFVPRLGYFSTTDFALCAQEVGSAGGRNYNLQLVEELIALKLNDFRKLGRSQITNGGEEIVNEAELLLHYFRAANSLHCLRSACHRALESWNQLLVVAFEACDLDLDGRLALTLQSLQILTPKLEMLVNENDQRAILIASSVRMLLLLLNSDVVAVHSPGTGEFANDRLYQVFCAAVRGISTPGTSLQIRETLYSLSTRYLDLTTQASGLAAARKQALHLIKSAGNRTIEIMCDDAFGATPSCRIASLSLLEALTKIAEKETSVYIIDSLSRTNFLQVMVESVENIPADLQETDAQDIPSLLLFYEAKFSLILTLAQSKTGAPRVLDAGLFHAIRASSLFSVDPDIGIAKAGISGSLQDVKSLAPTSKLGVQKPQSTIVDHFALAKQVVRERATDDAPGSSPSKRLKLSDHSTELGPPVARSRTTRACEMYEFPTKTKQTPSETIDLTSSPRSPPKKSAIGFPRSTSLAPLVGPKKLVVKNLKRPSGPSPEQYYAEVWDRLDASLSAVFKDETIPYSKETLYNEVMIICRQGKAERLRDDLDRILATHVQREAKDLYKTQFSTETNVEFIERVLEAWATWTRQLAVVKVIFFFLDRSYLLHARLPSVVDMGIEKFRIAMIDNTATSNRLVQGACDLIRAERAQQKSPVEFGLLHGAIKMFHELAMYSKEFEPAFMAESQKFFTLWAEQTAASTNLVGYVEMARRLFEQEMERADAWNLDATTKKELEGYLEEIVIDDRKARLCDKVDVGQLLRCGNIDYLHQVFTLLQRRRLGEMLRPAFESYIVSHGSEIVFDENREQEMVPRLLAFKRQLDQTWEDAFEKHSDIGHTLRGAFETFINKGKRSNMTWGTDNPKPGEMIAKYVDLVLKGGSKAIRASGINPEEEGKANEQDRDQSSEDEDAEIAKQLDSVLDLFRFVHGKAVFEAFYKRDLARRLLLGRSANSDAEKSMLTRLKSECGAGFTHNLEQMFKDIEMARDEIASYRAMLEEKDKYPRFDLNVNVLSASAWPSYPDVPVHVPEIILKATADFERNYKMKHSGRKLQWKHALGHCQLRSLYPRGAKEIVVSSCQAIVLLCFNDVESMSYSDVKAATSLDDLELKRTLQSLACAKYRVLGKSPKGKDVDINDTFAVNQSFHHPKYRLKINQIQAKETKEENKQTHERVAADRAFETQAAVVRIMKSRKTITHPELVSEVISATKSRGPLDPTDIKKNIEKLIEKDYMERDEDAHNTYSYVA